MDISLTPQIMAWIREKVAQGMYGSSSEVIAEGIRLLKRQDEQRQAMAEDLRQELLVGAMQLDTGKSLPFDAAQVSEIKSQGRKKAGI
ncbi:MAG: type II toxin-antitoxin system ParD family antitoxin [Phycisphaerales bacterium]|nr:MAG: type II toxin-antitoxin system ParD family antitoxin [Phycisphaerales bacterium]